jgi:copper chaperone CopZ
LGISFLPLVQFQCWNLLLKTLRFLQYHTILAGYNKSYLDRFKAVNKLQIMQRVNQKDSDFWQEATTSEGHAQLRVKVGGMDCSLCAGIIERAISKRPDLHKVSVSLPDAQVLIEYDSEHLGVEQLLGLLPDLGFRIGRPSTAHPSDEDIVKLKREGRLVLAGFALSAVTIPLMLLEM